MALSLGACVQSPNKPNILIILIDTLRADRLGCYGNGNDLTPFLDRFAGSATVFRHAYATSSWTAPSVASLFTSRYPSQHGVVSVVTKLDQREITLAELLTQAGYRTGAVVANDIVAPRIGYDQGFALFRNVQASAGPLGASGIEWLEAVRAEAPATPAFLYLHFMDPHWPYAPPQKYIDRFVRPGLNPTAELDKMRRKVSRTLSAQYVTGVRDDGPGFTCDEIGLLESLYNADVAALDAELNALFAELEDRHLLDNTIVVLTSDHGEEFLDHGGLFHAYTLYEESIRVPLIVRMPGQTRGRVVETPVSLVDVAPSLLRLLDLEIPPGFEGKPFADLLGGYWWPAVAERWRHWATPARIFAEIEGESVRQPQLRLHAATIIERGRKLLLGAHGEPEMYDLTRDPNEERSAAVAAELLADLHAVQRSLTPHTLVHDPVGLDAASLDRLRALGYGLAETGREPGAETGHKKREVPNQSSAAIKRPARRDVCDLTTTPAESGAERDTHSFF